ncbi:hypothetical protein VOLCADRAFT_94599, partial [Volvox carteri f. nagariensis]
AYDAWEAEEHARLEESKRKQLAARKGQGAGAKGRTAPAGRRKAGKKVVSDDDISSGGSDSDFELKRKPAPVQRAAAQPGPKASLADAKLPKPPSDVPVMKATGKPPAAAKPDPGPAMVEPTARPPGRKAAAAGNARRKQVVESDSDTDAGNSAEWEVDEKLATKPGQAGKVPSAKPAKPAATGRGRKPKPLPASSQGSEQPSVDDSRTQPDPEAAGLAARLAGRIQTQLNLGKPLGVGASKPTAANLVDVDEVNSPAPGLKTIPGAKTAAPKAVAAKGGSRQTAATAKQPAKRKGAAAKKPESEEDSEDADTSDEEATFELSAPSPAVAPKGKKGRVGPSPLGIKTLARATGGASACSGPMATVLEERPQRARRAAAAKATYIISSSEDDDGDKDSDFEVISD